MPSRRLLVAAALLAGPCVARSGAGVVALDARSFVPNGANPATSSEYSGFRGILSGAGHTLTTLTSFTTVDLAGVDLLILFHPLSVGSTFGAQEIADVTQFVGSGGHLWFVADAGAQSGSTLPQVNALLAPHGVTVTASELNPTGVAIAGFTAHEVTGGLTAIGLDYHRTLKTAAPAIDLTTGNLDVLAAVPSQSGGGRVAVVTDSTFLVNPSAGADHDLLDLDNRRLVQNLVDWFLPPFHDGCPGAGGFVPELSATSYTPPAGGQLGVSLANGLGGAPATFFFGLGGAEIPMVGGCNLNIAPLLPASFTLPLSGAGPGQGMVSFSGVLPAGTGGATFAMQAFVTDPSVPHGFSNSNEIVVAIQ